MMYPHKQMEGKSKYGKQYKFLAQHFQEAYNRYGESVSIDIFQHILHNDCLQGDGAPPNVHPNELRKNISGKVNHHQSTSYPSKELSTFKDEYEVICEMLEDTIEAISVEVTNNNHVSNILT